MEQNFEKYNIIKTIFLKNFFKKGKKINSEKKYKIILKKLKQQTKQNPNLILLKAINNLLPKIKLIKSLKKKNYNKYFLIYLKNEKQIQLSINWLLEYKKNIKLLNDELLKTALNKNNSKTLNKKKQYYKDIKKLKYNIKF